MFDGTDLVSVTLRVSSLKHFLQILQNLEFTYMQNSHCEL